ncbi:hypothetical protein D3C72_1144770 [compost metagenome]
MADHGHELVFHALEQPLLGDVLGQPEHRARLALGGVHQRGVEAHRDGAAVGEQAATLEVVGAGPAGQHVFEEGPHVVPVVRVGQGVGRQAEQRVLALADHLLEGGIAPQDAPLEVGLDDADRRPVEDGAVAGVARAQAGLGAAAVGDVRMHDHRAELRARGVVEGTAADRRQPRTLALADEDLLALRVLALPGAVQGGLLGAHEGAVGVMKGVRLRPRLMREPLEGTLMERLLRLVEHREHARLVAGHDAFFHGVEHGLEKGPLALDLAAHAHPLRDLLGHRDDPLRLAVVVEERGVAEVPVGVVGAPFVGETDVVLLHAHFLALLQGQVQDPGHVGLALGHQLEDMAALDVFDRAVEVPGVDGVDLAEGQVAVEDREAGGQIADDRLVEGVLPPQPPALGEQPLVACFQIT